jgi:hypothetical protein
MEVKPSSEMLVGFQWTSWHYIPDDRTFHNQFCENLKSYEVAGPCECSSEPSDSIKGNDFLD